MSHALAAMMRILFGGLVGLALTTGVALAQPTASISRSTIPAGYPAVLRIDLGSPAPAGGLAISLTSSAPSVLRFMSSRSDVLNVVIPGAARVFTVPLTTSGVSTSTRVAISVSGQLSLTANATVIPLQPSSFGLSAGAAFGARDVLTATVRLSEAAPEGGLRLRLVGSRDGLEAGSEFIVAGGTTEATARLRAPNLPGYEAVTFGATSADLDVEAARRLVRATPVPQSAVLHLFPRPTVVSVTPLVSTALVHTRVPVRIVFAPVTFPAGAPQPASPFDFRLSGHSIGQPEQQERYVPGQTELTAQYDVGARPTIIFPDATTDVQVLATERIVVVPPSTTINALQSSHDTLAVGDSTVFTITLAEPAPRGTLPIPVRVNLGGSFRVPPSVPVAEGARTVSFVGRATGTDFGLTRVSVPQQTAGGRRNSDGSVTIVSESMERIIDGLSILAVPRPTVQILLPTPTTVSAGQSGFITVQFAQKDLSWVRVPLPAHTLTLVSSHPSLVSGRSIQVNAGSTTETVPILAGSPSVNTRVTFTTTLDGLPHSGVTSLLVTPPLPRVTAIRAARTTLSPGDSVPVTVSFDRAAPASGLTVLLTSTVPLALAVPSSVLVPAGASSATFVAHAQPGVNTVTTASITTPLASHSPGPTTVVDGTSNTQFASESVASLTLTIAPLRVTEVLFDHSPVFGGLGDTELTVRLSNLAPAPRDVALRLTISAGLASPAPCTVPATVTIPAGARVVRTRIATAKVSGGSPVTCIVSAELSDRAFSITSPSGSLVVHPLPSIVDIAPPPADMIGGSALQGEVLFANPATPSQSSSSSATIPLTIAADKSAVLGATLQVRAGSVGAKYSLATAAVASPTPIRLTFTVGEASTTRSFTLLPPPPRLVAMTVDRTSVFGGDTVTATVNLDRPAAMAPFEVVFSSASTAVVLPPSLSIPVGASRATVRIPTARVLQGQQVNISVTERPQSSASITDGSSRTLFVGEAVTAAFTVVPPSIQQLLVDQPVIFGNVQRPNATIILPAPASPAGSRIVLTSTVPGVFVGSVRLPAVFTIPGGTDRRTVALTSQQMPQLTDMTLTAHPAPEGSVDGAFTGTLDAASPLARTVPMQLLPIPILSNIRVDPASVIGGNAVAILGDLTNSVRPTLVTANPPTLNLVVGSDRQDILASGAVIVRPGDTTVRLDSPTKATTTDVTVRLTLTLVITRLGATLLVRHP